MSQLEILLDEFYKKISRLTNLVERDVDFPNAPNKVKVVIGMRRVGKTYVMLQKIQKIVEGGVDIKSVLYVNFEDDRLFPLTSQKLSQLVDDFYSLFPENHNRKCYLFFDEIQNVEGWSLVIRRLHDTLNVEIFLSGSSAKLLSKEISTSLRGRSLAIELWPYSFKEFLGAKKIILSGELFSKQNQDILKKAFQEYLVHGGFPEVTDYVPDVRQQTLQSYLDSVLLRDIVERHRIKNPTLLKHMILSLIQNVGNLFTINKFYKELRGLGYQTGKDDLYEYSSHIEDAFVAFFIDIYTLSVRKKRVNPRKIYAIDPGLVQSVTLNYGRDLGRLFENTIFLDLRRHGCTIHYYRTTAGNEVDFIVQTAQGQKKCIQVTWDQTNSSSREREEKALKEGMSELGIDGDIITLQSYLEKGISL